MQLIHYRSPVPNFGDDLNAALWPTLAPGLFADGAADRGFVGIGTIIGMAGIAPARLDVFSSGAGYDALSGWAGKDVRFHCVRGPVTARLVGIGPELALTDGAILAPRAPAFPDRATGGGGTMVVPHFETLAYPGWAEACAAAGLALLDPRDTPEAVIGRIAGADLVLTESLHGAILADTYGVPWTAFATSGNMSTSKWIDWLASVGLDLEMTLVPPPNATQLFHFGRRPEPYGHVLRLGLEDAAREFTRRVGTPAAGPPPRPGLKARAKAFVAGTPALHRLLGFGPARTADALAALARRPGTTSKAATRERLQQRMADLLAALAREAGG